MILSSMLFTALAAALSLTFENATPASARPLTGRDSSMENSYIVKLKDGVNTTSHINSLPFLFSVEDPNSPITYWWPNFFGGYSGIFVGADLDAILASPDVKYVKKDSIATASASQTNEPWNLQAISSRNPVGGNNVNALTYTYWYTQPIGAGVDIYVIDTGVYTAHNEFQGRATFLWAAPRYQMVDDDGHGTWVAGIAAGKTYGVAKTANIIAVKVLGADGQGWSSDIIEGINVVAANIASTQMPSIVCMAINGPLDGGINDAANDLMDDHDVTLVVSAGNDSQDASTNSPGCLLKAIVVASSDISNVMASSSNFGPSVDIFAPGVNIISAGTTDVDSTFVDSGTSAAAAHVAGIAASFLSQNTHMTPNDISERIFVLATENVITGIPPNTDDNLVFNNADN